MSMNSDNISLLTEILKSDKISDGDRAYIMHMNKLNIDNYILENHHYSITEYTKNGYHGFKIRINSQKYLFAPDLETLKEKLYCHYSGKTLKEKATINSIFSEALDQHCSDNHCTDKTKKRLKQMYHKRIKDSDLAEKPIKDISAKDIKNFLKSFSDQITRKPLVNIKTILNFVLQYACEELEIVPYNVSIGVQVKIVKVLPEKQVKDEAYSEFEIRRIVSHLINSTNVYDEAIVFSVYVGLRPCELEALEWSDIRENTLILKRANTERGNLKTGAHTQTHKHLCSEALELLKRYKAERPDSTLIFPNKDGNCLDGDVINKHLKKACNALNLPYRSLYKTRSYVMSQIASTNDYEAVRKTGGHSNSYMMDHYINNDLTDANRQNIEKALNLGILSSSLNEKSS